MVKKWEGLVTTVQKFTSSIKGDLNTANASFHEALNGDDPLMFRGLGPVVEDRNEYRIETSDALFWHDPTAYLDELERWEGQNRNEHYTDIKSYLDETEQTNVFLNLTSAIRRKRITPFAGAGLTFDCGYPLWGTALEKLVKKLEGVSASEERALQPAFEYLTQVRLHISNAQYLEAAQLIYENHQIQLENFIRTFFDGHENKDLSNLVKLLPKIADGCIITTNFDGIIEKAFTDANRPIEGYMHGTQSQNQFASKLIQGGRCILKLHGHFDASETYIFSQQQYDDAYGTDSIDYTKPLSKVLRQIFISQTLMFLGCSLEQDRTLELFLDVVQSNAFDIPEHFAFLAMPNDNQKKIEKEDLLSRAKIRPIWYQVITSEDKQDHSQLEKLLGYAIDCAAGRVAA